MAEQTDASKTATAEDEDDDDLDLIFDKVCLIKSKLNSERIKLWLAPFTGPNGEKGEVPMEMVAHFANDLNLPEQLILNILEKLRLHSISKLKSREQFRTTGIATINVHIQWMNEKNERQKKNISVTTSLDENVSCLHEKVQMNFTHLDLSVENSKMIHKGKILNLEQSSTSQNVTNGSNIMVILVNCAVLHSESKEKEMTSRVNETKKLAEALSKRTDAGHGKEDHYFLEINDQTGKKITLPEEERQSLSLAMTLHEKGKVLMKAKEITEALLLFLEADHEFSNCRSELLDAVDNYAILCLDIVWCYFTLKKLDYLPDAELKLQKCKECFTRSYGPNMERLSFVKGSDINEMALFVRVHLLEAVCFYLKGNIAMASESLDKAQVLMKRLEIDDNKFTQLISMGFSTREARLSLRACRGDVTLAVEYISRKREEVAVRKERETTERNDRKAARKYGLTASGAIVNLGCLRNLEDMGFSNEMALAAVRQSNNDINKALEMLQNNPELLLMATQQKSPVPEKLIQQFVSLGFPYDVVERTLRKRNCDVDKCMTDLINQSAEGTPSHTESDDANQSAEGTPSHTESDDAGDSPDSKCDETEVEIDHKVHETLKDISQNAEDDYLNLTLEEEAELINKYRILIATSRTS